MVAIIAALPLEGLHWGAGDTERIKMKRGQKKKRWHGQHWGENASTVHRHQINDKMKKKKINYISYLVEPRKRQWKKEMMVCWTWGQWNQMQSATLSLSFLTVRLDFASKGKREDIDWNLNSTNKLYRKKEHLNVQVDFQTFLLKKGRKQSLEKKNRLSSFHIKLHYFRSFYYLSSFLEYQCFRKSLLP